MESSRTLRSQVIVGLTFRASAPELGEANLRQLRELLKESKDEEAVAWRLLIDRLETAKKSPLPKESAKDLALINKSKDPANQAVGEFLQDPAFGSDKGLPKLNPGLSKLPSKDLRKEIASVIVLEAAGKKKEAAAMFPISRIAPFLATIAGMLLVVALGVGAWLYYIIGSRTGQIRPKGFPTGPITEVMADRLAIRASILFLVFFGFMLMGSVVGAIPAIAAAKHLEPIIDLLPYATMVALVLLLPKDAVFGEQFKTKGLGVSLERLGEKIGIGTGGWFANAALLMVTLLISLPLTRFLPTNSHPAGEQMLANPDAATIIKVVLMGSIAAPIWEEIVFRGLLFPAIAKKTNSVAWGVFLSSLLFAAIHPQGPGAWLLLGTIGGLNCVLTYYTKSLVPAIVLHMLNNTAVFAFSYFINLR
jgi:membrane protease YdiL (CAAX protease family)